VSQNILPLEIIVADNSSKDDTCQVALDYGAKIVEVTPRVENFFLAPLQRRLGADVATGEYLFFADSDFVLPPSLFDDCLPMFRDYDALVIPEKSTGKGFWARTKSAERACYIGEPAMEAPRLVSREAYFKAGKWPHHAGALDDWVFRDRLTDSGARIGRTVLSVEHNEGRLRISKLIRKKLIMGKSTPRVLKMDGELLSIRLSPKRLPLVIRRLFKRNPRILFAVLFMKALETSAFFGGRLVATRYKSLLANPATDVAGNHGAIGTNTDIVSTYAGSDELISST
jgi:glycosyltransferase involved in cell wall biosynthesis